MLLQPVRYAAVRLVYRSIKDLMRHGRGLGPQVELRDLGCSPTSHFLGKKKFLLFLGSSKVT